MVQTLDVFRSPIYIICVVSFIITCKVLGAEYECRAGPYPGQKFQVAWRACRLRDDKLHGCKCQSLWIEGIKLILLITTKITKTI